MTSRKAARSSQPLLDTRACVALTDETGDSMIAAHIERWPMWSYGAVNEPSRLKAARIVWSAMVEGPGHPRKHFTARGDGALESRHPPMRPLLSRAEQDAVAKGKLGGGWRATVSRGRPSCNVGPEKGP